MDNIDGYSDCIYPITKIWEWMSEKVQALSTMEVKEWVKLVNWMQQLLRNPEKSNDFVKTLMQGTKKLVMIWLRNWKKWQPSCVSDLVDLISINDDSISMTLLPSVQLIHWEEQLKDLSTLPEITPAVFSEYLAIANPETITSTSTMTAPFPTDNVDAAGGKSSKRKTKTNQELLNFPEVIDFANEARSAKKKKLIMKKSSSISLPNPDGKLNVFSWTDDLEPYQVEMKIWSMDNRPENDQEENTYLNWEWKGVMKYGKQKGTKTPYHHIQQLKTLIEERYLKYKKVDEVEFREYERKPFTKK